MEFQEKGTAKIKNLYDSSNIVNLHMFKRSTAHEDELNKIKQENIVLKNTIECLKMENMAYEIKDLKSKSGIYKSNLHPSLSYRSIFHPPRNC
jgi:hypothetical protein